MNEALIGNCSYSALIRDGAVRWLCWPRMDSSFVFGPLLDEERGGAYEVLPVDGEVLEQGYLDNTNVLRTVFRSSGGTFELFDLAPRYKHYERIFKPSMLLRILRPLEGTPLVKIRCKPVYDYGRVEAGVWAASNHLEYTGLGTPLRLTTNVPLTYVQESRPFALTESRHLALTWGEPLESGLEDTAERFLTQTIIYWRRWTKRMRIPRDYQHQVIRSALALKLHQFEDTGALLAATTTSIPEFPGSGRTWDYRYCWLRDSYFTLNALERLGQLSEMERFLDYIRILAATAESGLQPLYGINGESQLDEKILDHLAGYKGDGPVRIGNQAYTHIQNDVYGEAILSIGRLMMDERFVGESRASGGGQVVATLLEQIEKRMAEPDAGLWELRGHQQLHSFTLLTHWAGASRAMEIGSVLQEPALVAKGRLLRDTARNLLETRCWDEERGVLTQAADQPHLDAAMLLALHFGFFAPDDPRASTHVEAIRKELAVDQGLLRRYAVEDDFGYQEAAFTVCSFWLAEALAIVGRTEEARELFEQLLGLGNQFGLYSEDINPQTMEQLGNFPQTYSHVGLINTAFRLSRSWE